MPSTILLSGIGAVPAADVAARGSGSGRVRPGGTHGSGGDGHPGGRIPGPGGDLVLELVATVTIPEGASPASAATD